ncbi:MMPL family transporter [Methylocella sp.]|uniref:hopanoid transporter HpnN n=1 Tax=Methylocella sp. TaxID=1978226 RepID=UPI0037835F64
MISPPDSDAPASEPFISRIVVAIVEFCRRFKWPVVALSALATAYCGWYAANNFNINTNTNDFMSADLPWRQNLIAMDKAFPHRADQIVVVIDGKTPEIAEEATQRLAEKLRERPDMFTFVLRPDGGPFFNRNGLLYLPVEEVRNTVDGLFKAQPFLSVLASDQSLRGVSDAFSFINRGVRSGAGTYDDFDRPLVALNGALDGVLKGEPTFFSWRGLLTGAAPDPRELRRFIQVKAKLDYSDLQPGAKPSAFIRESFAQMGFSPETGARLRLTGLVPLADEEFATLEEGAGLNGAITALIVLFIIWRALRAPSIVLAVAYTVVVGLAVTAAVGLWMVGSLNLISVAFAVLFVGIGVDFGIQYSVRYRDERHKVGAFEPALRGAAAKIGRPLALAAAATAAGFYSFVPTDYRGVSELGIIAGTGMFIAFFISITVLPALLAIFRPPAEEEPVGYLFLAPVDDFLERHRHAVVIGTLGVALLGTPLLAKLRFDFNPINLRSQTVESVSTLLDLMRDPVTDTNTIDVLAPSIAAVGPLGQKLGALPEVAQVISIESFVPEDQGEKLPIIEHAAAAFAPVLDPTRARDRPSDVDDAAALLKAADAFEATAADASGKGADDARRLADKLRRLADGPPETREAARRALLPGLHVMLGLLRESLSAQKTTLDSIPADLRSDWVAADGRARIAVSPKGDANDNPTLERFAAAVLAIDPQATGEPIAIQESGRTVVRAFIEAGVWALLSISILLWIVLRRFSDVLLTLVPLLLAGVVTLEITVLIGLPLNFANIIALPLLLGLGVAFKIYFVMAWRAGTTKLLQSSLTRAVFFSAMTTATAFGSLWLSKHPGTSSMGKLLALSLVCTLAAAILFQPALMGPPRKIAKTGEDA